MHVEPSAQIDVTMSGIERRSERSRHPRVVFVGGWGRSGSTLLDLMLGQVETVFSAGEVRELWKSGCVENRPCGCGQPFYDCPFWTAVGQHAFGGWHALDIERVLHLRYTLDRPWAVPLTGLPRPFTAARPIAEYLELLRRLFEGIAVVSGAQVVVDSSNMASHALLLRRVAGLDVRVVHLVRDSRGVAFSWTKSVRKIAHDRADAYLPQYGSVAASARWVGYNLLAEQLRRLRLPYVRVRYEDLLTKPAPQLAAILSFAGLVGQHADAAFVQGHTVTLGANHTVEGNPMRFTQGLIDLRSDQAWRENMPEVSRRVVTTLTAPLLRRYGYDVAWRRLQP